DFVAPRDFILPDPEATDRKRTEAGGEVLPVYDRDVQATARVEETIKTDFANARAIERSAAARGVKLAPPALRPALPAGIGEGALRAFARLHFSSDLELRMIAAAAKVYRAGLVDNKELLLHHRD